MNPLNLPLGYLWPSKRPVSGYSSSNKSQLKPFDNQQLETMKTFLRENLNPGSISMSVENTIIHILPARPESTRYYARNHLHDYPKLQ